MGLDIYAGTLTRYYSRTWKTQTQQFAEANGMEFRVIRPAAAVDDVILPLEEIKADMEVWRSHVLNGLQEATGEGFPAWEEDGEKPYQTDKPDWEAFGALVLYSACMQLGVPLPKHVSKSWRWCDHELIKRAREDKRCGGSLLLGVELWLPFDKRIIFGFQDPCGNEGRIGTVGGLIEELNAMNQNGWKASHVEIEHWSQSEGYPLELELKNGEPVCVSQEVLEYDTDSLAKFAFSILYRLAEFARDTGVPLKLDY